MKLFHVSEEPGIRLFEPRPSPQRYDQVTGDVVFAISEEMLHLYLTPRDCPRVCFTAEAGTTPEDHERWLGASHRIMAIEHRWRPALLHTSLYCYELPMDTFELLDANAGYFISYQSVKPLGIQHISQPLLALQECGVEIIYTADLWGLAEDVAASSLRYSCIRMHYAGHPDGIL